MKVSLLKFEGPNCAACVQIAEPLKEAAIDADVPLIVIDVTNDPQGLARVHRVRTRPTIVAVDASGNEIDRFTGLRPRREIDMFIASSVASALNG